MRVNANLESITSNGTSYGASLEYIINHMDFGWRRKISRQILCTLVSQFVISNLKSVSMQVNKEYTLFFRLK